MDPEKPLFDTICTLPLDSDLFAQAIHPTQPLLAVGLASGHVQTFRLPPVPTDSSSSNEEATASETGFGQIETAWRTRRHKGSCRSLGYSHDGEALYSAGTDGIVKCADTETGRVTAKIAVPVDASTGETDLPTLLHVLSPQTLLLATDSSALHLYDLRDDRAFKASQPAQTHHPHDDYISSLTPLAPTEASTSGFSKQWVSTGGTTLAVTDIRRGVLVRSEDQEEELLSSVYVGGLRRKGSSMGQKVLVGGAGGVITLWERGQWDDQDERIIVDRTAGGGESLDTLTLLPDGVGPGGKVVAVGMGNGKVRFVQVGPNKIIGELSHDDAEGVVDLGFDVGGRMISGGGQTIKVWYEAVEGAGGNNDEEEDNATKRRTADSSDEDDDSDDDSSEDERSSKRKKKKRRKGAKVNQINGGKPMDFSGLD